MMMAKQIIGEDPAKLQNSQEVFVTCSAISDDDPCELASKISDCLAGEGKTSGIDFSF